MLGEVGESANQVADEGGGFLFLKVGPKLCLNYQASHCSTSPKKVFFRCARKEALNDCQTSDPGGQMQTRPETVEELFTLAGLLR